MGFLHDTTASVVLIVNIAFLCLTMQPRWTQMDCIDQAVLKLTEFHLPLPPEYWDSRCVPNQNFSYKDLVIFILYVCVGAYMYVCAFLHAWCPRRSEEDTGPLGTVVTDSCEPQCWCWERNPGPLQEQYKLFFFFWFNKVLFFQKYSWLNLFMHLHQQLGHLHPLCFWCKLLGLCALKPAWWALY